MNYHGVLQYYIFILDLILLYVSVVSFNHRSVYPLFFDGTVIEKWWLSALVIKVYCKAAGQKVVSDEGFVILSLHRIIINYFVRHLIYMWLWYMTVENRAFGVMLKIVLQFHQVIS